MKFPTLSDYSPQLVPRKCITPGHQKSPALNTASRERSNSFKGSLLLPAFYGITVADIPGTNIFRGYTEFSGPLPLCRGPLPHGPDSNFRIGWPYYGQVNPGPPPTYGWCAAAGQPPFLNSDNWLNTLGYFGEMYGPVPPDTLTNRVGMIADFNTTAVGSGYTYGITYGVILTGGHGSGCVVDVVGNPDGTLWGVNGPYGWNALGYQVGDVLDVPGGSGGQVTVADLYGFNYPQWIISSLAVPYDLGSVYLGNLKPRSYQLAAAMWLDTGYGGWPRSGANVVWGIESDLPDGDDWPDVMSPNGVDLPFQFQLDQDPSGDPPPMSPGGPFDWTGSSIHVERIPKPAYPYR